MNNNIRLDNRVRTGHGKSGKSWNLIVDPGKSWKIKVLFGKKILS